MTENTHFHKNPEKCPMDKAAPTLKDKLVRLDQEFPFVADTNASRVFSAVRRMKAEKDTGVPIQYRTGFVISTKTGKRANEMTQREWEDFYKDMCDDLKRQYPQEYRRLFPGRKG